MHLGGRAWAQYEIEIALKLPSLSPRVRKRHTMTGESSRESWVN